MPAPRPARCAGMQKPEPAEAPGRVRRDPPGTRAVSAFGYQKTGRGSEQGCALQSEECGLALSSRGRWGARGRGGGRDPLGDVPLPQMLWSSGTRGGRGDRPLPHSLRPRAEPRLRARPLPLPSPQRPAGPPWDIRGTQPCYSWENSHILSVSLRQGEGRQSASGDHGHHVGSLASFSLRCTFLALATLLLCPPRPVPLPL